MRGRYESSNQSVSRLNELPGEPGIQTLVPIAPACTGAIVLSAFDQVASRRHPPTVHLRKEVIQPQVPLRLPCYDFTPITTQTLDGSLLAVGSPASGSSSFRGVTGGVYKARERIHRGMLIRDY